MGVVDDESKGMWSRVPHHWRILPLRSVLADLKLGGNYANQLEENEFPLMKMGNVARGYFDVSKIEYIVKGKPDDKHRLKYGDLLFNTRNTLELVGKVAMWRDEIPLAYYNSNLLRLVFKKDCVASNEYGNFVLNSFDTIKRLRALATGTTSVAAIYTRDLLDLPILLPSLPEQQAIATALSDADAYIESLEQLITKRRQIKQGVMQELLTGKRRLSGFEGRWTTSLMVDLAECLDHLRIPLNDSERSKMRGAYPYCGANGVLDYIDRYCVDDRVVLIAEDGGYFDEYATRPIAYRMSGRFWVNNHAHILKSKDGFNQDFLFYSLVHKNVLNFLASGTRAKLNKSELLKIPIYHPVSTEEQNQISNCLNDIDGEIAALETKVGKVRDLKQAMMQQLLTGKIRLV